MKIITNEIVVNEIKNLEAKTEKILNNLKSLHRKEKSLARQKLSNEYYEIFLDLYQLKNFKIDYTNNELFLKLTQIKENFFKIR